MYAWIGFNVILPSDIGALFIRHRGLFGGRKSKKRDFSFGTHFFGLSHWGEMPLSLEMRRLII